MRLLQGATPASSRAIWRALRPAVVILVVSLAATLFATVSSYQEVVDDGRRDFDGVTNGIRLDLQDAMEGFEQLLRGGVGLFNASVFVSLEEWRAYVAGLMLQDRFPAIQGMGFAPVVGPDEIEAVAQTARAEGVSGFSFYPEGERATYTTILYLEPLDWRNQRALGFDMFSEPVRRVAMERARDTGEPALSGKVMLRQETDEGAQAGLLLYVPVYRRGARPATIEDRRAAHVGYVYSPFRMDDLVSRTFFRRQPQAFSNVRLEIFDGREPDEAARLFDSARANNANREGPMSDMRRYSSVLPTEIYGATWTLRISSLPSFENRLQFWKTWAVLSVASILSLLLGAIAAFVGLGREHAIEASERLSAEVAERQRAEDQLRVVLRELSHRVKNMLSIVTAIASQTVRYSTSLQAFEGSFRQRLHALGRVQDLLASSQSYETTLSSLVHEVLKPYWNPRGGDLKVDGPDERLAANAAVLFSVLFNELATNATKHGAWSAAGGRVDLSWTIGSGPKGQRLDVVWAESGGPPVATPMRSGFGTSVMRFVIERSLGGQMSLDFQPAGVRYHIGLPWAGEPQDSHINRGVGDGSASGGAEALTSAGSAGPMRQDRPSDRWEG